jgi:hypothetical protein
MCDQTHDVMLVARKGTSRKINTLLSAANANAQYLIDAIIMLHDYFTAL